METELQERQKEVAKQPTGEMKIARKEALSADIKNVLENIGKNAISRGEGFVPSIPGASQSANIQRKAGAPEIVSERLIANFSETIKGLINEEKEKMAAIPKKTGPA